MAVTLTVTPALAATGASRSLQAKAWPKLIGPAEDRHCEDAYRLAQAMFMSPHPALNAPIRPVAGLRSSFSVYRVQEDISGGDGLLTDPARFSTLELPGGTVFWQARPTNGARVAVLAQGVGWRGDHYTTYVLSPSAAAASLTKADGTAEAAGSVLETRWNPPLVLTDQDTGAVWFINSGEPYEPLPRWEIHDVSAGAAHVRCRIAFGPEVASTVSLLPRPVQRLAASLDATLGPGLNEGTLRPTARIRLDVARAWTNAGLRPWALVDRPYNTRDEVTSALTAWASRSQRRRAVLSDIQSQYPAAEQSLAAYYRRSFGLPTKQAEEMARYAVDLLCRRHFVFHRDEMEPSPAGANPWPGPANPAAR